MISIPGACLHVSPRTRMQHLKNKCLNHALQLMNGDPTADGLRDMQGLAARFLAAAAEPGVARTNAAFSFPC